MFAALVRLAVSAAHRLLRGVWFVTRPHTFGVHAVPVTREGKIVLVRLTYRSGWHLPGGQRKPSEAEQDALLRELREEIGLLSCSRCELVDRFPQRIDWRHDTVALFRVDDVQYDPHWSLEIAEIGAFEPGDLPPGTSAGTRERVMKALSARGDAPLIPRS